MPTYRILSATFKETWEPEPGRALAVYSIGVGDENGNTLTDNENNPIIASFYQPTDAPPPSVGAVLNNKKLKPGKRGYTLSKDESAQNGQTQQEADIARAAEGTLSPKPTDWDAKDRRISRQHAQTLAVEIIRTLGAPDDPERMRQAIVAWANWLDADTFGGDRAQ